LDKKHKKKTLLSVSNEISYFISLDSVFFYKLDAILKEYDEVSPGDFSYPLRIENVTCSTKLKKIGVYPEGYFKSGIFIFATSGSHSKDFIIIRDKNQDVKFIDQLSFSNLLKAYLTYIEADSSLTKSQKVKLLDLVEKYISLYCEY
jgi:hypothetical protein